MSSSRGTRGTASTLKSIEISHQDPNIDDGLFY